MLALSVNMDEHPITNTTGRTFEQVSSDMEQALSRCADLVQEVHWLSPAPPDHREARCQRFADQIKKRSQVPPEQSRLILVRALIQSICSTIGASRFMHGVKDLAVATHLAEQWNLPILDETLVLISVVKEELSRESRNRAWFFARKGISFLDELAEKCNISLVEEHLDITQTLMERAWTTFETGDWEHGMEDLEFAEEIAQKWHVSLLNGRSSTISIILDKAQNQCKAGYSEFGVEGMAVAETLATKWHMSLANEYLNLIRAHFSNARERFRKRLWSHGKQAVSVAEEFSDRWRTSLTGEYPSLISSVVEKLCTDCETVLSEEHVMVINSILDGVQAMDKVQVDNFDFGGSTEGMNLAVELAAKWRISWEMVLQKHSEQEYSY